MVILPNFCSPIVDTPLSILPLGSLLIFSSISLISFSTGYAILSKNSETTQSTDKHEINNESAKQLVDCFMKMSYISAGSTLLIFVAAIFFSIGINLLGWIFKFLVLISLFYAFVYLFKTHFTIQKEMGPYSKYHENILNNSPP